MYLKRKKKIQLSVKRSWLVSIYKFTAIMLHPGNTKEGSITVPLTSSLTALELAV